MNEKMRVITASVAKKNEGKGKKVKAIDLYESWMETELENLKETTTTGSGNEDTTEELKRERANSSIGGRKNGNSLEESDSYSRETSTLSLVNEGRTKLKRRSSSAKLKREGSNVSFIELNKKNVSPRSRVLIPLRHTDTKKKEEPRFEFHDNDVQIYGLIKRDPGSRSPRISPRGTMFGGTEFPNGSRMTTASDNRKDSSSCGETEIPLSPTLKHDGSPARSRSNSVTWADDQLEEVILLPEATTRAVSSRVSSRNSSPNGAAFSKDSIGMTPSKHRGRSPSPNPVRNVSQKVAKALKKQMQK